MTQKSPTPDHFPLTLSAERYLVAVTSDILLETQNDDITQQVQRGVYTFTAFKKARSFLQRCNSGLDEPVAYLFRNTHSEEDEEASSQIKEGTIQ